ncbi:hypothetical protein AF72_04910 [Xylella taiwanensis]|uniref:Uncharacterized protein n=1 Tax=Xylella taiwanensis TaxID=1444770 RepID=Z9JKE7_9GAMM|nr:hypothetical protein AF72_04910 [Xylella taiwanensis]
MHDQAICGLVQCNGHLQSVGTLLTAPRQAQVQVFVSVQVKFG